LSLFSGVFGSRKLWRQRLLYAGYRGHMCDPEPVEDLMVIEAGTDEVPASV
jgi:hypothetical protein